jgi:hypothetical protein
MSKEMKPILYRESLNLDYRNVKVAWAISEVFHDPVQGPVVLASREKTKDKSEIFIIPIALIVHAWTPPTRDVFRVVQ